MKRNGGRSMGPERMNRDYEVGTKVFSLRIAAERRFWGMEQDTGK